MKRKKHSIRESYSSRAFDSANVAFMIILMAISLYPLLYVASASFSDMTAVMKGEVTLLPVKPTLDAYQRIFRDDAIWIGYWNSIRYTVLQSGITLAFTSLAAFVLSRRRLLMKRYILLLIGFTMLFDGGMIPRFLQIKALGLYNSFWALILPGAINTFQLFVMRSFFAEIPSELEDAAKIDGCGYMRLYMEIVLPLSTAVLATTALFTAVTQWNSFFSALIYLNDKKLYPLQIHLRNVIISGSAASAVALEKQGQQDEIVILETIKYATIMAATAPILCIYPFVQKYFVKGAMLGSVKG